MRVHGNSRKGPTPPLLTEFVREKLHMSMPDSFFIDSNVSTRVNGVEVSGLDDVFCTHADGAAPNADRQRLCCAHLSIQQQAETLIC